MKRYLAACLALTLASAGIPSACLAGPNGVATREVRYDDLDLSTPQGVKALDRRIKLAADQVCLDASGPAPGQQLDYACIADARASARAHVAQAIAEQHPSKSPALAETQPH